MAAGFVTKGRFNVCRDLLGENNLLVWLARKVLQVKP